MAATFEQWILEVMSGKARGVRALAMRAALAAAEPGYTGVTKLRNRMFDRGSKPTHRLPRPVVSIGNLTTGGTGKTPAVQWLVRALRERGHRPGILMRGYRKNADEPSDEEQLLRESLGVPVVADADRVRGAAALLEASPTTTAFVLDDGFQHRRVARDADVVLIDATNPFGYDHVLPRGLLREPLQGLHRAHVVILTRVDQADEASLAAIESRVRMHNAEVPIVRSYHRLTHALDEDQTRPIGSLRGTRAFALSGIGNPAAFERSLTDIGIIVAASRRFSDHHAYADADIDGVLAAARAAGAERVVTTEKDWVKLERLDAVRRATLPFVRAALRLEFTGDGEAVALKTILSRAAAG